MTTVTREDLIRLWGELEKAYAEARPLQERYEAASKAYWAAYDEYHQERRMTDKPSPSLLAAADAAAIRVEEERRKLAAMPPAEREAYIAAWAKRLAEQSVALGERGVGCACCDPDVKKGSAP